MVALCLYDISDLQPSRLLGTANLYATKREGAREFSGKNISVAEHVNGANKQIKISVLETVYMPHIKLGSNNSQIIVNFQFSKRLFFFYLLIQLHKPNTRRRHSTQPVKIKI